MSRRDEVEQNIKWVMSAGMSGGTTKQGLIDLARTLADEVDKVLSQAGEQPLRREGYRSGGWTLLDFGCVVVHIFSEEMRSFYSLDRLWSDAEKIDYKDFL